MANESNPRINTNVTVRQVGHPLTGDTALASGLQNLGSAALELNEQRIAGDLADDLDRSRDYFVKDFKLGNLSEPEQDAFAKYTGEMGKLASANDQGTLPVTELKIRQEKIMRDYMARYPKLTPEFQRAATGVLGYNPIGTEIKAIEAQITAQNKAQMDAVGEWWDAVFKVDSTIMTQYVSGDVQGAVEAGVKALEQYQAEERVLRNETVRTATKSYTLDTFKKDAITVAQGSMANEFRAQANSVLSAAVDLPDAEGRAALAQAALSLQASLDAQKQQMRLTAAKAGVNLPETELEQIFASQNAYLALLTSDITPQRMEERARGMPALMQADMFRVLDQQTEGFASKMGVLSTITANNTPMADLVVATSFNDQKVMDQLQNAVLVTFGLKPAAAGGGTKGNANKGANDKLDGVGNPQQLTQYTDTVPPAVWGQWRGAEEGSEGKMIAQDALVTSFNIVGNTGNAAMAGQDGEPMTLPERSVDAMWRVTEDPEFAKFVAQLPPEDRKQMQDKFGDYTRNHARAVFARWRRDNNLVQFGKHLDSLTWTWQNGTAVATPSGDGNEKEQVAIKALADKLNREGAGDSIGKFVPLYAHLNGTTDYNAALRALTRNYRPTSENAENPDDDGDFERELARE